MIKVLFVCLGNICRSPLAEGIFDHLVEEAGLTGKISSDSCGTSAYHVGERPDPRSIKVARENGIILESRARQFKAHDLQTFDYILPMDKSNLRNIGGPTDAENHGIVKLMMDYDPEHEVAEVPDPYYGGENGFQHVYDMLMRSNTELLRQIREAHNL